MVLEKFRHCRLKRAGSQPWIMVTDEKTAHSRAVNESVDLGKSLVHAKAENVQPVRSAFLFVGDLSPQPGARAVFCAREAGSIERTSFGGQALSSCRRPRSRACPDAKRAPCRSCSRSRDLYPIAACRSMNLAGGNLSLFQPHRIERLPASASTSEAVFFTSACSSAVSAGKLPKLPPERGNTSRASSFACACTARASSFAAGAGIRSASFRFAGHCSSCSALPVPS